MPSYVYVALTSTQVSRVNYIIFYFITKFIGHRLKTSGEIIFIVINIIIIYNNKYCNYLLLLTVCSLRNKIKHIG